MISIGLMQPKNNINVGAVLRAAQAFRVNLVAVQGRRYERSATDTGKAYRSVPLIQVDSLQDAIPFSCVPIAVEFQPGATPLPEYKHPKNAFYVFGPEDGGLGFATMQWCRDVVMIPAEICLNLAACVNVVLYDRMAKAQRDGAK